jgi:prepilin-type N-terminal cleavage/methylation domain-containing protein
MKRAQRRTQHGFSLIEMLMVVLILSIITGVVFTYVATVQKRYRTEEARLDVQQESREFLDQMVRDLHTSGYPNFRISGVNGQAPNPLNFADPVSNNPRLAVGLVAVSYTDILFEGDVDGSGTVSSIRYTLQPGQGNLCPCSISRSQRDKQAGSPLSNDLGGPQLLRYATQVQGVINTYGSVNGLGAPIAGPAPLNVAGNTRWAGITNQQMYGTYTTPPIFEFYDMQGNLVPNIPPNLQGGGNLNAGITAARLTANINIVINVLSNTEDMQTGIRPAASMRSSVRVPNL